MTETKIGYDNLKKIWLMIIEIGNVADGFISDSASTWSKISSISDLFDELTGILSCDWNKVKSELNDLDAKERAELLKIAKEKFDIDDDQVEDRIERGLDLANELYTVVNKTIDYAKEWRK